MIEIKAEPFKGKIFGKFWVLKFWNKILPPQSFLGSCHTSLKLKLLQIWSRVNKSKTKKGIMFQIGSLVKIFDFNAECFFFKGVFGIYANLWILFLAKQHPLLYIEWWFWIETLLLFCAHFLLANFSSKRRVELRKKFRTWGSFETLLQSWYAWETLWKIGDKSCVLPTLPEVYSTVVLSPPFSIS